MRKRFTHWSFLFPFLLFIGHQLTQKVLLYPLPLFDAYLDPFCLGAICFPIIEWERSLILKDFSFSVPEIAIVWIYLVIITEVLYPYLSPHSVPDILDAAALGLGTLWYLVIRKFVFTP